MHIDKKLSIFCDLRLNVGQASSPAEMVGEDADPTKERLPRRGHLFRAKSRMRHRFLQRDSLCLGTLEAVKGEPVVLRGREDSIRKL
jgi:hypothetical protein